MSQLYNLMERNFIEYASYVVTERAIPDLRDGLKPVQRRILHTMFTMDDGRFNKVANVIGETMKLHPHGDAAIRDALVVLANKGYFIEKQGNFGNLFTGHPAAAPRYIECRLTPLARDTLFNTSLTEFSPSYDGRREEPDCLPTKLPVLLLLGQEGIAVGMSTHVLPHNFTELLQAQIDLLKGKEVRLYPDFIQGGLIDVSEYDDGRGKVKVRARIEPVGDKKIVIRDLPFGTTTESLISSIESAAQKGKVKISSLNDYTTDHPEIEIQLSRGVYAEEVMPQLYAYTDCEVSISSNIVSICDRRPAELSVTEVLGFLTDQLLERIRAELKHELAELENRRHWLTLERIFIENRVYKRIEKAKTSEAVRKEVWAGMSTHKKLFIRPMDEEDVDRLLKIVIRRISAYDIARHKEEVEDVQDAIKGATKKLRNLRKTATDWLGSIIDTHGQDYPRRTDISTFETVDRREVARADIKMTYDPESGFFGSKVKGEGESVTVSEYDRVLVINGNGEFRIVGPVDKVLVGDRLLYCQLFDQEEGVQFTVVYRDRDHIALGKRVHIQKFIRDKVYRLFPGDGTRLDVLSTEEDPGEVKLMFSPRKRQRVKEAVYDLSQLTAKGLAARGIRLSPKPVSRIKQLGGNH